MEKRFKTGDRVYWLDPAIAEFEREERALQLQQTHIITEKPENAEEDNIITIEDEETGNETEVYEAELRHAATKEVRYTAAQITETRSGYDEKTGLFSVNPKTAHPDYKVEGARAEDVIEKMAMIYDMDPNGKTANEDRVRMSAAVNAKDEPLSGDEQEKWKKGDIKAWNLTVEYKIEITRTLSEKELVKKGLE